MSWTGKRTTSSTLTNTAAWRRIRLEILDRDHHQCQIRGPHCTGHATQVDHITNTAAGGAPLDPNNLQSACPSCNAHKASTEATHARNAWKRTPERHPGHL